MLEYSKNKMSAQPGVLADNVTEYKYYARLQSKGTIDLEKMADHMAAHNCPFSAGAIFGILKDAVGCMRESLLEGFSVELGDLGRFFLQCESRGAANYVDFTADNITAVNVKFAPGQKFENLRDVAEFKHVASRKSQDDAVHSEAADAQKDNEDDMRSE